MTQVRSPEALNRLWKVHHEEWRDPIDVLPHWREAAETEPGLLEHTTTSGWWDLLDELGVTLLVTREYEHLIMGLTGGKPSGRMSYLRLPHPSGVAVDRESGRIHVASTRNPNQLFELKPVKSLKPRLDLGKARFEKPYLLPSRATFLPGCLYMHDLAFVGGKLHANAVGENAVIRFDEEGGFERAWWPKCIEARGSPDFSRNYLQLNSIAAGKTLRESFFSASADRMSERRPGHHNFPVDKRGVIFSGATRDVFARGLTRPHSARLERGRVWVDNSGYGELGTAEAGRFEAVARLPGWTRGLSILKGIAFVGTSRVIPRFRQYAPGLDVDSSRCGVHAIELKSGRTLASLYWPRGNQIFAVDWIPKRLSPGFPFFPNRAGKKEKQLFYSFQFHS